MNEVVVDAVKSHPDFVVKYVVGQFVAVVPDDGTSVQGTLASVTVTTDALEHEDDEDDVDVDDLVLDWLSELSELLSFSSVSRLVIVSERVSSLFK